MVPCQGLAGQAAATTAAAAASRPNPASSSFVIPPPASRATDPPVARTTASAARSTSRSGCAGEKEGFRTSSTCACRRSGNERKGHALGRDLLFDRFLPLREGPAAVRVLDAPRLAASVGQHAAAAK